MILSLFTQGLYHRDNKKNENAGLSQVNISEHFSELNHGASSVALLAIATVKAAAVDVVAKD